jgi:hypothetical protein
MRRRYLCATVSAFAVLSATTATASVNEVSSFQAGDAGWHLGTLGVGQLDADPALEVVIPYRSSSGVWHLDAFNPDGTRLPGFPQISGSEMNVSPTLYDLTGDGQAEILYTCGPSVIARRGNGSLVWSNQINRLNYLPDSGFMTVTNGFYWSNSGDLIPRLPSDSVFSSQVSSPIVADVAGTGLKQVVTAWKIDPDSTGGHQDFNPFINNIWGSGEWGTMGETWSGGVVFFNAATGAKEYIYHIHQLVESGLALGRADTNAPLKTYVLNDSDGVVCFDRTRPHGLYGNDNLHRQFGKNQRLMSGSYQQGVDTYTADIDGDGLDEVLVPTTQLNPLWQPNETILDDDGAILWRLWKDALSYPIAQWQNNACMFAVNPDQDNRVDVFTFTHGYEIAFRTWNGIDLVNRPGWPKNFYPLLPTPPVVGDVDGDGQQDVVIGTHDPAGYTGNLQVFALDGTLKHTLPVPGGLKHIPSIANVFGTGLCVVYRSQTGRVSIQNFGSTGNGPVSWATHRGNARRDGNLGLPLYPPNTPIITSRQGGYARATFNWRPAGTGNVQSWRIYRADDANGPFQHLVTLTPQTTTYTDSDLECGHQYFYEVAAVLASGEVRSAPFAVRAGPNNNLVINGGFEENSDSHWDKWFTGELDWTNMVTVAGQSHQGRKAMKIMLRNSPNGGSISQNGQYGTPDCYMPVTPGVLYSFGGFFRSAGISQNTAHWLEWSSAVTGENTNARPSRPYPGYFTPHFTPGTAPGSWTYANRAFVMPAGFPNIELTHWFTTGGSATGDLYLDDVFFRALPALNSGEWSDLIPFGSTWRFSSDTPPANWFAVAFSDMSWPLGYAKFGIGGGPQNVVTPLPPQRPSYYFRRTFQLPSDPCEELLLAATCTDAGMPLEIYLNGVLLNTTGIEATSGQGNEVQYYDLAPFLNLLHPGQNTIAVRMNNVSAPTWDDVAFDISLKTTTRVRSQAGLTISNLPTSPGAAAGALNPPYIGLNVTVPPNTVWTLESADRLGNAWQLVDVISNLTSGSIQLPDLGQNGRQPPSASATRYYRLVPR